MSTENDLGPFTMERARDEIERQVAQHDQLTREHKRPTAIELGRRQKQDLEAELHGLHGRDTGPLVSLHGLQVIPVDQDDHVALVYSGVAGA